MGAVRTIIERKLDPDYTQIVQGTKMFAVTAFVFFLLISFAQAQDKFQKCCGDRKLYHKGECYSPLTQGPCNRGEWLVMEKGGEEGVCRQTPCESPIQFLKNGECIFSVDLTKRGLLCSSPLRPWYSVYGDWDCKRTYLSLPFGLISDKTTPQDPVWADCRQI